MPGPIPPSWLTQPLVPKSAIQGTQDALDTPTEGRSPLEAQIRGFGSGALEGLRGLTSPANIVEMGSQFLAPGAGRMAAGAAEAAKLGRTGLNAAGAVQGLSRAIPQLSENMGEFAPVGGEAVYNAGRGAIQRMVDPVESAYQKLLAAGGRSTSKPGSTVSILD